MMVQSSNGWGMVAFRPAGMGQSKKPCALPAPKSKRLFGPCKWYGKYNDGVALKGAVGKRLAYKTVGGVHA